MSYGSPSVPEASPATSVTYLEVASADEGQRLDNWLLTSSDNLGKTYASEIDRHFK